MFNIKNFTIEMYEGDFGEKLPMTIIEGEILEEDILTFIIQDRFHNNILMKELELVDDYFVFSLTEEESKLLKENTYLWGIKQYRDNYLVDTKTANNIFKVTRGQ